MNVSNCSAYELIEESKILDLNSTGYLLRHKKERCQSGSFGK